jgi:ribonuclease J
MNIKIHQGANSLGGNCVEIQSIDTSILIDAGIPVTGKSSLNKPSFRKIADRVDAIFISHPHPDHYEMLKYLESDTPVYMSPGCKAIVTIAHKFGQTDYNPETAQIIEDDINLSNNLNISALPVDHSGFDSQAFLIANGKENIFYSGDLRDHGAQKYLTENLHKKLPIGIDTLILEGTLLSRDYKGFKSEDEVEQALVRILENKTDLTLITFSAQNIDRFVKVYRACRQNNKTLVLDPYTIYILDRLKDFSTNLPQYFWDNIGVLFAANNYTDKLEQKLLYRYSIAKVTKEMIRQHSGRYVLKSNGYIEGQIQKGNIPNPDNLIFSVWHGYADGIWKNNSVQNIHCSGHAQIETLKNIVDRIDPKTIIPIHTEQAKRYQSMWGDRVNTLWFSAMDIT